MNKFRMVKAGINVNDGINRLFGDSKAYEELLAKYLNYSYLEEMQTQLKNKDAAAAFQAAHALKGIAGNLCLTKVYDLIVPIVETLRVGDLNVDAALPALLEANEKAVNAIKDMVASNNAQN